MQIQAYFLALKFLSMSLYEVIPILMSYLRIRISIRKLNIIDTLAIVLNAKIKVLAVDEKLWEIVKLWD